MKRRHALAALPATLLLSSAAAVAHTGHGTAAEGTQAHALQHILIAVPTVAAIAIGYLLLRMWLARRVGSDRS